MVEDVLGLILISLPLQFTPLADYTLQRHAVRLTWFLFTLLSYLFLATSVLGLWGNMTRAHGAVANFLSYEFTRTPCSALSQPRLCMATDWQQWEWAANQPRPPVATWRPVRGTRSGSCPAGSEAPRPSARRGSCSCWWRRKSAGWNGRVR